MNKESHLKSVADVEMQIGALNLALEIAHKRKKELEDTSIHYFGETGKSANGLLTEAEFMKLQRPALKKLAAAMAKNRDHP
jgi:hypothetical protein